MILNFNQIKKEDVMVAGGKGANLGELTSIGVNVPTGFVITSDVYRTFIKENGIDDFINDKLEKSKADKKIFINNLKVVRQMIENGIFSDTTEQAIKKYYLLLGKDVRVAVRSSATAEDLADASFAGQQETYLNVKGLDDVLNKIKACYASLWSDRAVNYRINQNYDEKGLAIAVVVQIMVESEKSGVLFTVNPVNKNNDEILINASYGLGESVVSGLVNADSYVINKSDGLVSVNIGDKQVKIVYDDKNTKQVPVDERKRKQRVLSDDEINNLLDIGLKLEKHYDYPVDVEWAIKNGELYILQARLITTLESDTNEDEMKVDDYVKHIKIKTYNRKLMSFLIEKIPFAFRAIEYDYFTAITTQKATIFKENGICITPNLIIDDYGIMTISREKVSFNKNIYNIFTTLKNVNDYDYCARQCRKFVHSYRKRVDKFKNIDFEHMDLHKCKAFLEYSYLLVKKISYYRFKYGVFPAVLNREVTKAIKKVDKSYTAFDLYWGLNSRTALIAKHMLLISDAIKNDGDIKKAFSSGIKYDEICQKFPYFKSLTEHFLNIHGFKTDYISYCVEGKTFYEHTDRIVDILRPLVLEEKDEDMFKESKNFAYIMKSLKIIYGKDYPKLANKIKNYRYFHFAREEGQYLYETIFYYIRKCLKRVNQLLVGDDDYELGVENLFYDELITAINDGSLNEAYIEKINKRNEKLAFANRVWNASKLSLYKNKGDVLSGISGNDGVVVGSVCIVNSPDEFYKMKKGDILVCRFTSPEWTPLFKLASAVVADTGSALSHAAIVAREFGIPAVLGVGFATNRFKDGDIVKVDGNKGEVMKVRVVFN